MKRLLFIFLLVPSIAFADSSGSVPRTLFESLDNSVTGRPRTVEVTNGVLEDRGNSTFRLNITPISQDATSVTTDAYIPITVRPTTGDITISMTTADATHGGWVTQGDWLTWTNDRVSDDANLTSLAIIDQYTFPAADGGVGEVLTTNGTGTLSFQAVVGGVASVNEGTASPLEIGPTTGAVLITMQSADTTTAGYVSAADWNIWTNDRVSGDVVTSFVVDGDTPLIADPAINDVILTMTSADTSTAGYVSSADWNIWTNDRVSGDVVTSLAEGTASPIELSGSIDDIIITMTSADTSTPGYVSAADWNTWTNDRVSGDVVTSLTEGTACPIELSGSIDDVIVTMTSADTSTAGYVSAADWNTWVYDRVSGDAQLTTLGIANLYNFPVTDGSADETLITDGAGNVDWGPATAAGGHIISGDGYTSNVLLAIRAEGMVGATGMVDYSTYVGDGSYIETVGGLNITNVQKPFGSTAISFDAATSYIDVTSTRFDNISTFTLSFHIRYEVVQNAWVFDWGSTPADGITIWNEAAANEIHFKVGGTTYNTAWIPSANTWYHYALTRDSAGDVRFFVNGTQQGETQSDTTLLQMNDNTKHIGTYAGGTTVDVDGWMKDIVLTRECLWAANFTAPTTYLTDTTTAVVVLGDGESFPISGTTSVGLPTTEVCEATLYAPDGINDVLPIMRADSYRYPSGITIKKLSFTVSADTVYQLPFEEWAGDPPAYQNVIDTLSSDAVSAFSSDTTITDGAIDANDYVYIHVPDTDVDYIQCQVIYEVNP